MREVQMLPTNKALKRQLCLALALLYPLSLVLTGLLFFHWGGISWLFMHLFAYAAMVPLVLLRRRFTAR